MSEQGEWVRLRPWAAGDAAVLPALADDPRVVEHLRDRFPHPYTRADADRWLAYCAAKGDDAGGEFAVVAGGSVAGGIGLDRFEDVHRGTAEIGYWLGVAHWGRGIATAAVRLATAYGFDVFGLERIQACVFSGNDASCRVLEKAGFAYEGRMRSHVVKRGVVRDVLLYARVRGDAA